MTNEEAGDARFVPVVRPLGGLPYIYHGYVFDRKTAKMVASCSHRHTRRRQPHGFYTSGSVFAERCARRLLREFLRETELPPSK